MYIVRIPYMAKDKEKIRSPKSKYGVACVTSISYIHVRFFSFNIHVRHITCTNDSVFARLGNVFAP